MKITKFSDIIFESSKIDIINDIEDYFIELKDDGYEVEIKATGNYYDLDDLNSYDGYPQEGKLESYKITINIDDNDDTLFNKVDSIIKRMKNYTLIEYVIRSNKTKNVNVVYHPAGNSTYREVESVGSFANIFLLSHSKIQKSMLISSAETICKSIGMKIETNDIDKIRASKVIQNNRIEISKEYYSKVRRSGSYNIRAENINKVNNYLYDMYSKKFNEFLDKLNTELYNKFKVKFEKPNPNNFGIIGGKIRLEIHHESKSALVFLSTYINTESDSDYKLIINLTIHEEEE